MLIEREDMVRSIYFISERCLATNITLILIEEYSIPDPTLWYNYLKCDMYTCIVNESGFISIYVLHKHTHMYSIIMITKLRVHVLLLLLGKISLMYTVQEELLILLEWQIIPQLVKKLSASKVREAGNRFMNMSYRHRRYNPLV